MAADIAFDTAASRIAAGIPAEREDALALTAHPNLAELGMLAHQVRLRRQADSASYTLGWATAFSAPMGSAAAESRSGAGRNAEQILRQSKRLSRAGGVELSLFGDPDSPPSLFEWETLLGALADADLIDRLAPGISLGEAVRLARAEALPLKSALHRLMQAGIKVLRSESIGRAEAISWAETTRALRISGAMGLPATAALPRAMDDGSEQVDALFDLRAIQEETGLILAFASGPVGQRKIGRPLEPDREAERPWSSFRYLRALAVSRCVLDNVPHVQSAWEDQGAKIGQLALRSGADDFGSAAMYVGDPPAERISWMLDPGEMERLIRDAGFGPVLRSGTFQTTSRGPVGLPIV